MLPPILEIDLEELNELAKQLVLKSIAVPGVQPKLSLHLEKKNNQYPRLTIVGFEGDYILKPSSFEFPELPENEDLSMRLAGLMGIKTAKHTLVRLKSGELCYLTKRFDRKKNKKIAVEDFCQLSENLTEYKYRSSVEKAGKLIQKFTTNKGFEIQRFYELVLFSFLIGNSDMHLKNYALMKNKFAEYELSPAYDLLNTHLVIDDKEESALSINAKKNKLKRADFIQLAHSFGIQDKPLNAILERFENSFSDCLDKIHSSFLSETMKIKYAEIIQLRFDRIFGNN